MSSRVNSTFPISDMISVYSSSISRPRISPKTWPVPAGQLTSYDESHYKTTELPHHYHLPHSSHIIIMDMCRPWANESLQKINDTGVIIKKYMLSSTITVSLWWYMGSWVLRSMRCSRRALSTIILSGGGIWYFCAGDIYIYIYTTWYPMPRDVWSWHTCVSILWGAHSGKSLEYVCPSLVASLERQLHKSRGGRGSRDRCGYEELLTRASHTVRIAEHVYIHLRSNDLAHPIEGRYTCEL